MNPQPGRQRRRGRSLAALLGSILLCACLPEPSRAAAPVAAGPRFSAPAAVAIATLQALDARLALMDGVAAAKWQSGDPILDAAREHRVLAQVDTLARQQGLDPDPVRAVFATQMRLARDWQSRLHERWQAHGGLPPGMPVPDLGRDVRPQLDALTTLQSRLFARDHADWGGIPGLRSAYQRHQAELAALARLPETDREALWSALATLRAAPGTTLQRIRATGMLRVGLTGDYAPFSLEQPDGRLGGTDVVLAERLAAALAGNTVPGGVTVRYVRTTWRTLLPDLLAGRFDVALGGISVTADRTAVAAFSPPYHQGGKTFLARCTEAARFATLDAADQPGVRVLVNPGGTNERFVRGHFRQASIRVIPDNRAVFAALVASQGDLMVTDDVEVALQTRLHPALCRATPLLFEPAAKAVLMPRDPLLQGAVDGWMRAELAAGIPAGLLQEALRGTAAPAPDPPVR